MYDVVCVCICMYVIFCFLQHAKGKCLLRPGLGTLKSTVKNVPNRNKTPEMILGLEHPPAELTFTVPTAHMILIQTCTGLVAQLAERRAWYPKVLGSNPTFSTKNITCLSPAVGGLK